jgi:DNA-binding CsgD family transcriptional regulator
MSADIFGREAELRELGTFLDGLVTAPAALVLAGAAGAGKTTLLRAGAALAAERGMIVLQSTPAGGDLRLAFAGLADLLEPHLADVVGELPAPQARALRVALLLEDAPALPPESRAIAAALRGALSLLATSAPVLMVIDDVQWLDSASEAAVGFAIRRVADEPVGLLCAQRSVSPGADLPLELARARLRSEVLPVGGLSLGAVHRMLRARLGTPFSHPALRRIEAGSAGNPFVALEIGRALVRRGSSFTADPRLPVPATLSGLVGERLGTLAPAVMDAIQLVAVMPDEPADKYLAAGAHSTALDDAILAGLLEEDGDRLRFTHPLLAAAVDASIPPARKRSLHEAAAGIARLPEERARHQALAATGPSAPVAQELAEAGHAAAARGAPSAAAELFELAAELTPGGDGLRDRRRLDSARQLAFAGDTGAARALLEELTLTLAPGADRSDALSQLGRLREDDLGVAAALLRQALDEAYGDMTRAADIRMALSDIALATGDQAIALEEARHALADAEAAGDPALLASALAQAYCYAFITGSDLDDSQLERALELEQTVGRAPLRTQPSFVAGFCHLSQGRLEEAEIELQRVLDRATADGVEYSRADALLRLSLLAVRRGNARHAAELAAAGLEIAEQLDLPQVVSALLYGCGRAALQLGEADKVRALARQGTELATRSGDRPYVISYEALLGSLDLALGEFTAAAGRYRPLLKVGREMGMRLFVTQGIAPDAVEAFSAAGYVDEADELLTEVAPLVTDTVTEAAFLRCRGAVAIARGELDAATADLQSALRLLDRVSPQPVERGRTLLALGVIQRRLKQRAAARETLTEAMTIFTAVEAPLWAARARAELTRISGRAQAADELTSTERQVAELVARGLSNREVAGELFVSVRAVESTLTKTYAKLGVRSRTELASKLRFG